MSDCPDRYTVIIEYSDEDKGFIAIVPDLPGCSAWGETRAKAAEEIDSGIFAWMAAAEASGNPIPKPR